MSQLFGMEVYESQWVPADAPEAVEDWRERLAAMTLHHLDLSLLDLTTREPCVFVMEGKGILCHPNSLARLLRAPTPETPDNG